MIVRRVLAVASTMLVAACSVFGDFSAYSSGDDADAATTSPDADASGASDAPSDRATDLDASVCQNGVVLVGSNVATPTTDGVAMSTMDTYGYPAIAGGLAHCAWLYMARDSTSVADIGVFANGLPSWTPATLVARATIAKPREGWNVAALDPPLEVTKGEMLWLGILPLGGDGVMITTSQSCAGNTGFAHIEDALTDLPNVASSDRSDPGLCLAAVYLSP